ncbi:OadG family transporter subunit [Mariniflexile litorale]|uniref:OadG family transporter subunit n=1 Tax=Mariniflexile litorale TaxID=3045158 RepID=A0AAU7E9A3_9FLAO|nr:OadG family transporter subunit [Mariniflexile sp. KMM 9835]MDQ8210500.1 OadG family transporter subunit [Mariniflexile sp. KMM 9835]
MTHLFLFTDTLSEGYVILVTGLTIVFGGLLLLTLFFKYGLPVMLYIYKIISKGRDKKIKEISPKVNEQFTGEMAAAISAAIHMYLNAQHDNENAVLTIKQARKLYSPWSSKIYSAYGNRL